jgi:hypothetical protein
MHIREKKREKDIPHSIKEALDIVVDECYLGDS